MKFVFSLKFVAAFSLLLKLTDVALADGPPVIKWKQRLHDDRVNSIAFSADGTTLVSGGSDRLIHFYRATDGQLLQTLNQQAEPIHENAIENLALSPNGQVLATEETDHVNTVKFSPNGLLAYGRADGTVVVTCVDSKIRGALAQTYKCARSDRQAAQ